MEGAKKVLRLLSSVLFYVVMFLIVVIFIMFLAYYVDRQIGLKKGENRSPLFGAYVIISESMIPSINVYDAVVTVRVGQDNIKMNDIITFISKDIETAGTPITHRVIGIVETENGIKYRTKGDHNNTADFALIAPDEVIGKVYLRIPMIGYLQTFMTKPIGWLLIVVIPCLLIIGSDVIKLIRNANEKNNQNSTVQGQIDSSTGGNNLEDNNKENDEIL